MQGGLLSFTKSKAKVYMEKAVKTTFADVAGIDEAKEELQEVVSFLREPQRYARLGGRIPKGVLLVGPPGTGKTLLARAIAGEANVPFFSINGSEFVEMFVGLGAARVRDLFEEAKKSAPCILFVDEIDALGKSRAIAGGSIGANDEKEQTLNQLLAEMDGFDPREGVILLAATNRPEILDPALLRAGRFDRQVLISLPDQRGRAEILKVHLQKIKADKNLDVGRVAALTPGFSGADLANIVNEAALVATRRGGDFVTEEDFSHAIERVVAGLEQKSRLISPEEKRRVAYHEIGHTTVALALGTSEKVHKVSIIPRGIGALGYTLRRPTEDRYLQDEDEILAKIAVLLAGRAAEKLIFGKVSTGAADDLSKATDLARAMVASYGMSERLGLAVYDIERPRFLSMMPGSESTRVVSEATARSIDQEVQRFLARAYELAQQAFNSNRDFVRIAAERLLAVETLDEAELSRLWQEFGQGAKQRLATSATKVIQQSLPAESPIQ
jgi:cell division protease FtsH